MKHVVVFGVDGVRTDALRAADTPHIDRIAAGGTFSEFELSTDAPTMSGPTWASVATGQRPFVHGVFGNHFPTGHRLDSFPDFLARVKQHGRKTYYAMSWAPLLTIFRPPTRGVFVEQDDWALAEDAARTLSTHDIAASFVYLGNPDDTAHHVDTGPAYRKAIEDADRQIGVVTEAIAGRPSHADEEWTFVVVTDHGHRDGGGHGGRSTWERTAWAAACGPGIVAGVRATHLDIAPTVLTAAGVPIHSEDGFAGCSFQSR